jgi:hypothetical protein
MVFKEKIPLIHVGGICSLKTKDTIVFRFPLRFLVLVVVIMVPLESRIKSIDSGKVV